MKYATLGRCFGVVVLGAALFGLAGCGSGGSLRGKATHAGVALPAGTRLVFVHEKTAHSFNTQVNDDGTYSIDKLPTGTHKIGVQPPENPTIGGAMMPGQGVGQAVGKGTIKTGPGEGQSDVIKPPPGFGGVFDKAKSGDKTSVQIDPKYKDPETSGLTVDVTGGRQTKDIDVP